MFDAVMIFVVLALLAGATAAIAATLPRALRSWVAVAYVEYVLCGVAQILYSRVVVAGGGGDTLLYSRTGAALARFLDTSFKWAAPELLSLLLQQPSAFDRIVEGAGTNTGSMGAAAAWLIFFLGGAEYAVHFLVTGLSLLGTLAIFRAFRDAYADVPPIRLFVATVIFPSVAFWTAAIHKEAFCIVGIGLLLTAWRLMYRSKIRALLLGGLGVWIIVLFRAPVIPPLLLGLVVFAFIERFQRVRGGDAILVGPVYLALGIATLAVGMLLVTRVSPTLALDRIGETISLKQQTWAGDRGGSAIGTGDELPAQTLGAQLFRIPLALVNALFRPQLFDVHNVAALLSALEMTAISWMIIQALRIHGIRGILVRIQKSPFLMMCTVITIVGCTFVGLVTLNFGSLARYRVPFLPFYGTLVAVLARRPVPVAKKAPVTASKRPLASRQPRTTGRSALARRAPTTR